MISSPFELISANKATDESPVSVSDCNDTARGAGGGGGGGASPVGGGGGVGPLLVGGGGLLG